MNPSFRLVMQTGPTPGRDIPLQKSELFIGRDSSNDIVINDAEVSRRHARLFLQGTSYMLEDLGSTNGSFINGQRLVGPTAVRPGEIITLGERINLVFEIPHLFSTTGGRISISYFNSPNSTTRTIHPATNLTFTTGTFCSKTCGTCRTLSSTSFSTYLIFRTNSFLCTLSHSRNSDKNPHPHLGLDSDRDINHSAYLPHHR